MTNDKILGIVSIVPKGEWSPNQYYERLNLVTNKKALWLAKTTNREIEPSSHPNSANYWMKLMDGSAIGKEGKSAYEIWLELGNTGTETDFLNSLRGEQGEQGKTGKSYDISLDGTTLTITELL